MTYCQWLTKETGKPCRLPSEAEWEYACRAGTTTRHSFGEEISENDANYFFKVGKTTDVSAYPPNPWGVYDMHGNVREWVEDIWAQQLQGRTPQMAPRGSMGKEDSPLAPASAAPAPGEIRPGYLYSAFRVGYAPTLRAEGSGLPGRLVRT